MREACSLIWAALEDLPNLSEAIRRLVDAGLEAKKEGRQAGALDPPHARKSKASVSVQFAQVTAAPAPIV